LDFFQQGNDSRFYSPAEDQFGPCASDSLGSYDLLQYPLEVSVISAHNTANQISVADHTVHLEDFRYFRKPSYGRIEHSLSNVDVDKCQNDEPQSFW
jgi:hypothetical protein